MKIKKLSQVLARHAPKIVVYGSSGSGKTTLIGSLPGRVLILSAEAGLLSLRLFADEDRFDVVEVKTIDDVREVFTLVSQPRTQHGYDWLALDSASEIAEVVLAAAKAKTKDPRQAYGEVIDRMTSLLRAFRDLPDIGVYVSAKESVAKDEATGRVSYGLSMPGAKLGEALPYLFDEVLRLVVVDRKEDDGSTVSERYLQTARDARSTAKDRSGALDAPFEVADLGVVVEKISGASLGAADDEARAVDDGDGYAPDANDNPDNEYNPEAGM